MSIPIRIPEGGAIDDVRDMSSEQYSEIMRKRLWGEYQRFVSDLLEFCPPPEGARALEVGPGPGWIGIILAKARPDISIDAVDASADMARAYRATIEAEGLSGRIDVRVGSVERLEEAARGPYALVYSRDSLHHWEDPVAGFRSIRALLAPGGTLFLKDERRDIGLAARCLVNLIVRLFLGPMGKYWKTSIAAGYTCSELESILEKAGFDRPRPRSSFLDLELVARI
jgi:SAM-dependent methyltransferase